MALIAFFLLILVATVVIPQYVVILLVLNLCAGLFLSIFQIVYVPSLKALSQNKIIFKPFLR